MAIIIIFSVLLLPSIANAWGPLTHIYLGYQIIDLGYALVPSLIYSLIKRYRKDFLYGNLSADIIIGRRFQTLEKSSHSWDIAWKLLEVAKTDRQRAFSYGYLMHLCADTVVHNIEFNGIPFSHSLLEVRADSVVEKKYRIAMRGLDKYIQRRHDPFLEKWLESTVFSFKTNKRIFKGFLLLSRLQTYKPVSMFMENRMPYQISMSEIYTFRNQALERMFDLLANGRDAMVLKYNPLGRYQREAS